MAAPSNITVLLEQWRNGDPGALDRLAPAIYDHLHMVAQGYLRGERAEHTLQATGLVNEVFLRLIQNQDVSYRDRSHFFTFAAKLMRRILVDHARKLLSLKRGQAAERVTLAPEFLWVNIQSPEMLDLDTALNELAEMDPEKVRIVELRFFLGATATETAELLDISKAKVDRDIRFAVSWLHQRLTQKTAD